MEGIDNLLQDRGLNAGIAWFIVIVLGIETAALLSRGAMLYVPVPAVILLLAVLPPLSHRDASVMVPWELLLAASFTVFGTFTRFIGTETVFYLSIATAAFILAAELQMFTGTRMTDGFAALFVAVTTLAAAGFITLGMWLADIHLQTALLTTLDSAMQGFIASMLAGIFAGAVFTLYARRLKPTAERIAGLGDSDR